MVKNRCLIFEPDSIMTELDYFLRLKEKVLLKYQEHYPFFKGSWKSFSSQDIQNLIGLIEVQCKQSISEKWIYTHLKPDQNIKVPRKDMLNILSGFIGYSGWDEFVFRGQAATVPTASKTSKSQIKITRWLVLALLVLVAGFIFFNQPKAYRQQTIELQNEFTNEKVNSSEVKVYQVRDTAKKELVVKKGKVVIASPAGEKSQIIIQSAYYKPKTVVMNPADEPGETITTILLKPDDHAMMLKAFMVSGIKDWQTRKAQLRDVLSDDLEVIVMLKDNLGAEFFNKEEFSQKLIVPSASLRKMKIVEMESDAAGKIKFIRISQQ